MNISDRFKVVDDFDEKLRNADMEEFVNAVDDDFLSESMIREDLADLDHGNSHYNYNGDASQDEINALGMLTRDDGETIKRLVNSLHQKSAECRSMEYQLQHCKMQLLALQSREQDLVTEQEQMHFTVAQNEQDLILLETKLQTIANYEGNRFGGINRTGLDEIRGKLLTISNSKLEEVQSQLLTCQLDLANREKEHQAEIIKLSSLLRSTKEELSQVCDHLSQRTVLYAYQERRWNESNRFYSTSTSTLQQEHNNMKGRLQQLETQFEKCDKSRIENEIQSRQWQDTAHRLSVELDEANTNILELNSELAEATTQIVALQGSVDRLRGTDIVDLERNIVSEVEGIRSASRVREDGLRRQLEDIRQQLLAESNQREDLLDTIKELREDLDDKTALLRQIQGVSNTTILNASYAGVSGYSPHRYANYNDNNDDDEHGDNSRNINEENWYDASNVLQNSLEQHELHPSASQNLPGIHFSTPDTNPESSIHATKTGAAALGSIIETLHNALNALDYSGAVVADDGHSVESRSVGSTSIRDDDNKINTLIDSLMNAITNKMNTSFMEDAHSSAYEYLQHQMSQFVTDLTATIRRILTNGNKLNQSIDCGNMYDENGDLSNSFLVGIGVSPSASVDSGRVGAEMRSSTGVHPVIGATNTLGRVSTINSNAVQTQNNESPEIAADIAELCEEIHRLRRREHGLMLALKKQGKKLAIVLRKASELSMPQASTSDDDYHQLQMQFQQQQMLTDRLQRELNSQKQQADTDRDDNLLLQDQLSNLREELTMLETTSARNRELGKLEAAEDIELWKEKYESLSSDWASAQLQHEQELELFQLKAIEVTSELQKAETLTAGLHVSFLERNAVLEQSYSLIHDKIFHLKSNLESLLNEKSNGNMFPSAAMSCDVDNDSMKTITTRNEIGGVNIDIVVDHIDACQDVVAGINGKISHLRTRLFDLYRVLNWKESNFTSLPSVGYSNSAIYTPQSSIRQESEVQTPCLFLSKDEEGHSSDMIDVVTLLEDQLVKLQNFVTDFTSTGKRLTNDGSCQLALADGALSNPLLEHCDASNESFIVTTQDDSLQQDTRTSQPTTTTAGLALPETVENNSIIICEMVDSNSQSDDSHKFVDCQINSIDLQGEYSRLNEAYNNLTREKDALVDQVETLKMAIKAQSLSNHFPVELPHSSNQLQSNHEKLEATDSVQVDLDDGDSLDGDNDKGSALTDIRHLNDDYREQLQRENCEYQGIIQELKNHIALERENSEICISNARIAAEEEYNIALTMVREQHSAELDQLQAEIAASAQTIDEWKVKLSGFIELDNHRSQQIQEQSHHILYLENELKQLENQIHLRDESIKLLEQSLQDSDTKFQELKKRAKEVISETRKRTKAKYQEAFLLLESTYNQEKTQIVELVRKECELVIAEAKSRYKCHASGVRLGVPVSSESGSDEAKEILIYPEMLSPEVTYELVRSIASRSQTEDEFKSLFVASRVDVSESAAMASQTVSLSFRDSMASWPIISADSKSTMMDGDHYSDNVSNQDKYPAGTAAGIAARARQDTTNQLSESMQSVELNKLLNISNDDESLQGHDVHQQSNPVVGALSMSMSTSSRKSPPRIRPPAYTITPPRINNKFDIRVHK